MTFSTSSAAKPTTQCISCLRSQRWMVCILYMWYIVKLLTSIPFSIANISKSSVRALHCQGLDPSLRTATLNMEPRIFTSPLGGFGTEAPLMSLNFRLGSPLGMNSPILKLKHPTDCFDYAGCLQQLVKPSRNVVCSLELNDPWISSADSNDKWYVF